jgi:hypothetical protein
MPNPANRQRLQNRTEAEETARREALQDAVQHWSEVKAFLASSGIRIFIRSRRRARDDV